MCCGAECWQGSQYPFVVFRVVPEDSDNNERSDLDCPRDSRCDPLGQSGSRGCRKQTAWWRQAATASAGAACGDELTMSWMETSRTSKVDGDCKAQVLGKGNRKQATQQASALQGDAASSAVSPCRMQGRFVCEGIARALEIVPLNNLNL